MNKDDGQGKWRRMWGQARRWWATAADGNLYGARGKLEPFVDVLQAKYGYTREAAEEEFKRRMAQFEAANPKHKKAAYRKDSGG
jgi:uncharacterized protein YjbJ (UPF0337 family)